MLHFILDPLFYVLLRLFPNILKVVFRICQPHQSGPTSLAITDNEISPTVDDQTTPAAAKIITVPNIWSYKKQVQSTLTNLRHVKGLM